MSSTLLRIVGVTSVYHTRMRPERGAFTRALFEAWRALGHEVQVVSPVSLIREAHDRLTHSRPAMSQPQEPGQLRPWYLTVSNRVMPWADLGGRISSALYGHAVTRGMRRTRGSYDFAYAHFFDSGHAMLRPCARLGLDLLIALGESDIDITERIYGPATFAHTLRSAAGVLTVSPDLESYCRTRVPELGPRLRCIPNGINTALFYPKDRREARRRVGLPEDVPIVVFTGYFENRKGPLRVLKALKQAPELKAVFLGQGEERPEGPQVLRAAPVSHMELPDWLAAADFFVLPSRTEGMSNAILEALGCGLPLVVSDRSFNRSFLTEECTLFVDPESPYDIGRAFRTLLDHPDRREGMAAAARQLADQFSLARRAERILEFRDSLRKSGTR
jgi:teichuronic acid biosynthesis glycosyltransferase TuaC